MTTSVRFLVCLFALVASTMSTMSTMMTSAQQPDQQAVKTEVNAFMDLYWQLFSSGDIDQLVSRIYHPFGQLSNQGHASIDQMRASFPASRKALLSGGYGRSNMPVRNVCVLAPTVAVVSGRGIRYLKDGSVMGEFGWTYTLVKGANGWRMVSIYSHDPKTALTCAS